MSTEIKVRGEEAKRSKTFRVTHLGAEFTVSVAVQSNTLGGSPTVDDLIQVLASCVSDRLEEWGAVRSGLPAVDGGR